MEIFCHINELRFDGYANLRTLILTCPKVIIWAPSASLLDYLSSQDPLLPTKDELLWYIKNGHLQVMARDWWLLNSEERQKHSWEFAHWVDGFDDEIREMWLEDRNQGKDATARVRGMPTGTGQAWAKSEIKRKKLNSEDLLNNLRQSGLQLDYVRRGLKEPDPEGRAAYILGAAKNHADAFRTSGATRNFGTPANGQLLRIFAKAAGIAAPQKSQLAQELPYSTDQIVGVVEGIVDKITKVVKEPTSQQEVFEYAKTLLDDKGEIARVREWFSTADDFVATKPLPYLQAKLTSDLVSQIKHGALRNTFRDFLLPKTWSDWGIFLTSLTLAATGTALGSKLAPLSVALWIGRSSLQWLGYLPDDYTGPRWPFYLAEGSRNPNRRKRERLIRSLQSFP